MYTDSCETLRHNAILALVMGRFVRYVTDGPRRDGANGRIAAV